VDGSDTFLQSRNGRPLSRYFPEITFPEGRYVLDGELLIHGPDGREEFDLLGQRIHPAASRIERLSVETPAVFMAFDLLAEGDDVLLERPYGERRAALEALLAGLGGVPRPGGHPLELTPMVRTTDEAQTWLHAAEGVIAKEWDAPYVPGSREGMVKIKRVRTADVVVAGWRPGKEEGTVGSLMLGLYDAAGDLHVIGHTSGFKAKEKRELPRTLAPYETGERGTADPSRWAADRDLEWIALRPELVVEIAFDHVSDGRIRHGAKVQRWREDKPPRECTLDQLDG